MLQPSQIIKEYIVTEKSTDLEANLNKHAFEVYPTVNRIQVKQAVEKLFNVEVSHVNIMNVKGKRVRSRSVRGQFGKKPNRKKAIVTLKEGNAIDLL